MAEFVTLSCPSCGAKLQITSDLERFACSYCGNEQVVRRGGGVISLLAVAEDVKKVREGVDKTSAELAIARLRQDIVELERKYRALESESDMGMVGYGAIGLLISLVAFGNDGVGFGFLFGIPSVLLLVGAFVSSRSRQEQKDGISSKIFEKKKEIEQHTKTLYA